MPDVAKAAGEQEEERRPSGRKGAAAMLACKAVPHLLVVVVMPTLCFLCGRSWWGLAGGVGLALTWNLGCQAVRWAAGQALSTVLVLSLTGLLARSSLAVAFHSARMYFLAPAVFTAGTGLAYIASVFRPTPLVARIVAEFVPDTLLARHEHACAGLLRKGTLFYGIEQVLSAAVSVAMVFQLSTTAYATVHPLASWLVLVVCVALAVPIFRQEVAFLVDAVGLRRLVSR